MFTLAFSSYFGVERPFHQLAHNLVLSTPGLGFLRKYGTVAAPRENARRALRAGAAVLVYPGGDHEVFRPSWERHRIDSSGRKGFVRVASDERSRSSRSSPSGGRRPPCSSGAGSGSRTR